MIQLAFNAKTIPRTTTREQWRAIDRWRRVAERKLREEMQRRVKNIMVYGTSHPEIYRRNLLDEIINPPIMTFPPPEEAEPKIGPRKVCDIWGDA